MQVEEESDDSRFEKTEKEVLLFEEEIIDFNIVLSEIGGFKRYQILLVIIMYLVTFPSAFNIFGIVFLEATPKHWCTMPSKESQCQNVTFMDFKTYFIPFDNKTLSFANCLQYNHTLATNQTKSCKRNFTIAHSVNTTSCQHGNSFNKSVFNSTVVTEWNLVCSRSVLKAIADSTFFLGIMTGGIFGGYFSDRYGRVSAMIVSLTVWVGFGVGLSYAPSFTAYVPLRFAIAACLQMTYLSGFVYVTEICGNDWRTFVGVGFINCYSMGGVITSLLAYWLPNWRTYQFYTSLFPIPIVCCLAFVPESPRWLLSKGKNKKAKRICEKMARWNGKPLPTDVWRNAKKSVETTQMPLEQKNFNILDLFKRSKIRLLTIKLVCAWFAVSLVYYGLILNVGNLTGNIFLNNSLNALMEIIGNTFAMFTMDKLGRKPLLFGTFLLAGVCCLIAAVLQGIAESSHVAGIVVTILCILGILAIAMSFAIMYSYTVELYPTVIRSNGLAAGHLGARLGSILTPFALFLHKVCPWATGTIYGVASISASIVVLFLPETLNKPMLTTIEETEEFLFNISEPIKQTS